MREIKFRAWLTDGDGVTYPNGAHMEYNVPVVEGKYADIESGWDIHGTRNYPLMQYTGLKDKNGKEIYEGDIYKYDVGDGEPEIGVFESIEDFYYSELIRYRVEDGEIIGNIYENPELLTN